MRLFTLMSSRSPFERQPIRSDLRSAQPYHRSDGRLTRRNWSIAPMRCASAPRRSPTMTAWRRSRRPGRRSPAPDYLDPVNGVEISTLWENHEIHIVGLNIDIAYPTMTALLEEQKARRQQRGQMIAERRRRRGSPALEGALRLADGGAVTRPFARFLVETGHAKTWRKSSKIPCPRENRLRAAAVVYNKTSD